MRIPLLCILLVVPLPLAAAPSCPAPRTLTFTADTMIRRDVPGFTEGLEMHDGAIYESTGDFFGFAIGYDGSTAVITAPSSDIDGNQSQGAAYFYTRETVFADGLGLARALKVLDHGVLVGEPPNLWLMKDTNGDLKMDTKESVANTFGDPQPTPAAGVVAAPTFTG